MNYDSYHYHLIVMMLMAMMMTMMLVMMMLTVIKPSFYSRCVTAYLVGIWHISRKLVAAATIFSVAVQKHVF